MASAPNLFDVVGLSTISTTDGPIVGASEPALRLAVGAVLSTGDLAPPEVGSVGGGGSGFSIEFWFRASGLPGANQAMFRGPATDATNSQYYGYLSTTGSVVFNVFRETSVYGQVGSAPILAPGVWYHLVFSYTIANVIVYVNGVATSGAFGGTFVHGYDPAQVGKLDFRLQGAAAGPNFDFSYLAFYVNGPLSAARIAEHYRAGTQLGRPAEAVSTRIGAALDAVSNHAPRSIGASARSVAEIYFNGEPPVATVGDAVSAEAVETAFFTSAGGKLTFLGSAHRAGAPYNTIQSTFGDAAGELPYLALELDYSDSYLGNYWSVTRTGTSTTPGVEQVAQDATSISRYSKRPKVVSGLPLVSDGDASTVATALLAKYKDPLQRITAVTFSTGDPDVAEAVLQRELMDKVRIIRTPHGGGSRIQQDVFIQKIDISAPGEGEPWTIRWAVSPL